MTRRLLEYGDDLNSVLKSALDAEKSAPASPDAARLAKIGAGIAERIGAPPPPNPPNPPAPQPAPAVTSGLAAKAPFVLLAAATIAGLAFIASLKHEAPTSQPAAPVPTTVRAPEPAPEPAPSEPGVSLNDLPSAPAKPAAKPVARTASEAEEIALIGRAHDALRNDPQGALALCKEHETKYGGSAQFAQEREAVAIEALVYSNRKDDAQRRFAAFDRKYPASSHRVHLQSLLAR